MPNDTTLPYSVPAHLQGETQKGFQGGKNKVLELFNTLDLEAFIKQFTQQVLPLKSLNWFSLDSAKFVLPIFEKWFPNDKRVSNCFEVVESYLNGKSNLKQLSSAADAACDAAEAADDADNYNTHTDAANAAYCAAYCAADAALDAAYDADNYNTHTNADARAASWAALNAYNTSKDEMQGFVKNWIDNYFDLK